MRKFGWILVVLLEAGFAFSQNGGYNELYWKTYADKIHLEGKEREEFLNSHERIQSPAPISPTQAPQAAFRIMPPDNIFAGPCINADFEAGNITGWLPTSGFNPGFNPSGCCPSPGGVQVITSGPALDPYGGFPKVCPGGGSYSLRLGDSINGGHADRIEQTFLVSPSNANFSYKYAVVLQDPGHPPSQQPSFQVEMLDTTNTDVPCTYFYVAAGQGIPGFSNSPTPGVIYKPWTTVLVDLSPYIGQNITIRFTTYDCSLGGHFGYAYIDGVCQSFVGGGSATVCAGAVQNFCAPTGLASYTWNGPGVSNFVGQCVNATLPGIYTVQTTLFTNCNGPTFTYTLGNQPAPVVNAGPNVTVCANNNLVSVTGSITGWPSTPQWLSSGSGIFTSPASLTSTYTPSPADISAGLVTLSLTTANNGICPPSTSTLQVTITPSPVVNAGSDQTICATAGAPLSGSVTGTPSTGVWSSSGTGTFTPSPSVLNATYFPGPADISAGSVTLTLTSTNNQGCIAASDNMLLFFQAPPLANAGSSQSVCANNNLVSITGSITGYSATPQWSSSGSGVFTSTSNLTTTYTPSNADILSGSVIFTLTTVNNGVCPPSTSTLQVSITPAPLVNAGTSQTICSNSSAALSGSVTGPTNTGAWTSAGDGTFTPSPNTLNATYTPGPNDIQNGSVTLSLTSTGNGNCLPVTNTISISVHQLATVNAGTSQSVCSTASSAGLTGTVTGSGLTGLWTTNGSGTFSPGPSSLFTSYMINPADVGMGTVIFTLTSTNNGPCPAISSTVSLSISQLAQVNAGNNQFICESSGTIALSGSVNIGSGIWTSNGTGTYNPGNNSLSTVYSITPSDINNGSVSFTLTSTNNGACPAISDSVMISIRKLATVNAGNNQAICSTASIAGLTGTVSGGTSTGLWTTNGAGTFNPGPASLFTSYIINPSDVGMGTVIFTLTSTNNGPCPAITSTVSLNISLLAQVNAGNNQFICGNSGTISLNGTINTGNGIWVTNGGGTFNPGNTSLNTTYSITPSDINSGSVNFTLVSTNNGACPAISDSMKIAIKKLATVNAGNSQAVCSSSGSVSLNGTIGGGSSTGFWAGSGTGAFNPGATSLNTSYFLTVTDINAGSLVFTLTSTNNGPCPAVTDTLMVQISIPAQVNAGPNQLLCETTGTIGLIGMVSSGNGIWTSSGTGSYSPDDLAMNPAYTMSGADVNAGFVTFTLTSTNNGACPPVTDSVKIVIKKLAHVNAGPDKSVCSVSSTVALAGLVSGGSFTGAWSTNGSGYFTPANTSLNNIYNISGADMSAGSVTVVLTSLNNGICPAVTDSAVIKIFKNPSISVSDTSICSYQNPVKISPVITGYYGNLLWTSSGSGVFLPTNISNPVSYNFSNDMSLTAVTLSVAATNNGPCADVKASVRVTIHQSPTADFTPSTYTANIPNDPISFTNQSFQANAYYWSFGDGNSSGAVNPVHNYQTVGFYNVMLISTNQFGCSDTAFKDIKVVSEIQYPNAFTPNPNSSNGGSFDKNDYSNDVFFPYTAYEGVTGYDLQIFNRWGELIFESKNVLQGWDGYFKGKICQQDVYVWKARVQFFDGRLYEKAGSVTLLR